MSSRHRSVSDPGPRQQRDSSPEPSSRGRRDSLRGHDFATQERMLAPSESTSHDAPVQMMGLDEAMQGVGKFNNAQDEAKLTNKKNAELEIDKHDEREFSKCHYTASALVALLSADPRRPEMIGQGASMSEYGKVQNANGFPDVLTNNAKDEKAHMYRLRFDSAPDCRPMGMHSWVVLQQGTRVQHLQSDDGNYTLGQWMKSEELSKQQSEVAHKVLGPETTTSSYAGRVFEAAQSGVFDSLVGIAFNNGKRVSDFELTWEEWALAGSPPDIDGERLDRSVDMAKNEKSPLHYMKRL